MFSTRFFQQKKRSRSALIVAELFESEILVDREMSAQHWARTVPNSRGEEPTQATKYRSLAPSVIAIGVRRGELIKAFVGGAGYWSCHRTKDRFGGDCHLSFRSFVHLESQSQMPELAVSGKIIEIKGFEMKDQHSSDRVVE